MPVSIADLEQGWRRLSEAEEGICSELLVRAEAMVNVALARAGVKLESEDERTVYKTVVCDMVQNAMVNARNYSDSFTDSDVYGEQTWEHEPIGGWLRLTEAQLDLLGLTSCIWTIQAKNITDEAAGLQARP